MKIKIIKNTLILVCIIGGIQLAGCKKKNHDPSNKELLSATWTLEELVVDGSTYEGDISAYQLTLNSDLTFSRTDVDGTDTNGNWSLTNDDTILKLNDEEYIIVSLTTQKAVLNGTSHSDKTGDRELTYNLVRTN